MSSVTIINPTNNAWVNSENNLTVSWITSPTDQRYYQIRYRKVTTDIAEPYIYDSGKVSSTTTFSFVIPYTSLQKNTQYEIQMRVWTGSTGSESQSDWKTVSFIAAVPTIATVRMNKSSSSTVLLRVVPLGKSNVASPVKIKTPTGIIGEFDIVPLNHRSESGVRIKDVDSVIAVAKPYPPSALYVNHSDTAYKQYSNHSNYVYPDWYDNHYDNPGGAYYLGVYPDGLGYSEYQNGYGQAYGQTI